MEIEHSSKQKLADWRQDLINSRDLTRNEIDGFGFFLGWYENCRRRSGLSNSPSSARQFWKTTVLEKPREQ